MICLHYQKKSFIPRNFTIPYPLLIFHEPGGSAKQISNLNILLIHLALINCRILLDPL